MTRVKVGRNLPPYKHDWDFHQSSMEFFNDVKRVGKYTWRSVQLSRFWRELSGAAVPGAGGLLAFHLVRGKSQTARELGEQYFSLGQRMHSPTHLLWSHWLLGLTLFHLGEVVPSREHLEQGVALYDLRQHRSPAFLSGGVTPGVGCLSFVAWILGICGHPDQALKRSHEALTLAQELAHPYSLAFALNIAAILSQLLRKGQAAQQRAAVLITLSTEQGFTPYLAEGTMLRGWALTEQGKEEEGLTQIQQGLSAQRVTGEELERPYWLALLAEAYGKVGQAEEGLSALAEALGQVDKTGARLHKAELYRLKGDLLLTQEGKNQRTKVKNLKGPVLTPNSQSLCQKLKRVFSRPLRSRRNNKQNRWNYARR